MEQIVGWMKIHDPLMGMGFTLHNAENGSELAIEKIGRGGATLLREPQNIIFQFRADNTGWEQYPQEWLSGNYFVAYNLRVVNPGKRKYGLIIDDDFRGTMDIEGPVVIHYYCKHSPTDEHVEELMALARRYIEVEREFSVSGSVKVPAFLVRIVTDTDVVLSESEELTRAVNLAIQPTRSGDVPLLLSGGFSPETILAITSIQNAHPGKVPTFYVPKRLNQVSYPVPRQNKRKIYR